MPDTTHDKVLLRRRLLADRQAIAPEVRRTWDRAIGARVITWWRANPAQTIGVYWPIREEPDLRDVYEALTASGVQLALPVVVGREAPLCFAGWSPGDPLVADAFGVSVPQTVNILQPDVVLVPCVGFNADNIRLGYGGGFYDRTLAATPRPLAIGIAYHCSMASFIGDPHDIALDDMITEQSSLDFEPVSL